MNHRLATDRQTDRSSLDCGIWHSFCSFSYSYVYSDHVKLSSDVINCRRKKWKRKLTLSPLLCILSRVVANECNFGVWGKSARKVIAPPLESELSFSTGTFFEQLWRHRRKLQALLIHVAIGKRAKRTPDPDYYRYRYRQTESKLTPEKVVLKTDIRNF